MLKTYDFRKAKNERGLLCKVLADVAMGYHDEGDNGHELQMALAKLAKLLFKRNPEYLKWKKHLKKSYRGMVCPVKMNLEKFQKAIEAETGYSLEAAMDYVEVNFFRRLIAMKVNPWKEAFCAWHSRPGCTARSPNLKSMCFDRRFFEGLMAGERPSFKLINASPELKMRREKANAEFEKLKKKFPEDSYLAWGTKEDEMMFWAIMTQDALKDLKKKAMSIRDSDERASYGSLNEIGTAKHWPDDIKQFEWPKMVLKASLEGKDEKWLHAQFAMWLESKLTQDKVFSLEKEWDFEFMTRPDDFGLPNPKMFK